MCCNGLDLIRISKELLITTKGTIWLLRKQVFTEKINVKNQNQNNIFNSSAETSGYLRKLKLLQENICCTMSPFCQHPVQNRDETYDLCDIGTPLSIFSGSKAVMISNCNTTTPRNMVRMHTFALQLEL